MKPLSYISPLTASRWVSSRGAAGVTAAVVVAVAFAGVVFDYDILFVLLLILLFLLAMLFFLSLLQLMMLMSLLLLMLMHNVYAIIFELMTWRVLFV